VALVLDASTMIAFLLADETSPVAEEAMRVAEAEGAVAPVIWWYEIRNALVVSQRRRRLSKSEADTLLEAIVRLRIEIDRDTPETIVHLARKRAITIYDAAYLELALRREHLLATLDADLARAATAEGVGIVGALR